MRLAITNLKREQDGRACLQIVELGGTSDKGISEAIETRSSARLGRSATSAGSRPVEDASQEFHVTLKVGLTLDTG
jgi:flavin-binding protein dodecin